MAKKKWYVVTRGRATGVFETWLEVSPLVTGFSGLGKFSHGLLAAIPAKDAPASDPRPVETVPAPPSPFRSNEPKPRTQVSQQGGPNAPAAEGSRQNTTLMNLPMNNNSVASEETSSSPPTGVTQIYALPERSVLLSPLGSFMDEPNSSASSDSVPSIHSSPGSLTSSSRAADIDDYALAAISSDVEALSLSPIQQHIPGAVDPRSPSKRRAYLLTTSSSRHPSPTIKGEGTLPGRLFESVSEN
ncbi:hypothetical protein C8J57DRAFT_1284088 [Mycena rebaudengoi]|nr:hypothetical protein C8J57DRAFT_1284088 [Mycena rebaudengoi]